jgi:hypothetical protein
MRIFLACSIAALGAAGCATHPEITCSDLSSTAIESETIPEKSDPALERKFKEIEDRLKFLAAQPTPSEWRAGSEWSFTSPQFGSRRSSIFRFRVTDEPASACLGGTWHRLINLDSSAATPAYSLDGRSLTILLSTGLCDAYDTLSGELSGGTFTGTRNQKSMFCSGEAKGVTGRAITATEE